MAANEIADLENLLIHYNPELVNQIYRRSPTLDWIKGNVRQASGEQFQVKMMSAFAQSVGDRPEGGVLPDPKKVGHSLSSFTTKFSYGTIDVSRPAMKLSSGPASLGSSLAIVMSDMADVFADDQDRQLHGDSSGALATMPGASNADPFTVSARALNNVPNNVEVGMDIDLMDATDGTTKLLTGETVSSVTSSTITTGVAPAGTAAGDFVTRAGNVNNEMFGFRGMISDENTPVGIDNYGGIDRSLALNAFYNSTVIPANTGLDTAELSEDLLQQLLDDTEIKSGDRGSITDLWMPYEIRRKYEGLLRPDRRFQGMMFTSGGADVERLSFNGIPVQVDKYAHANIVLAVNRNRIFLYQAGDPQWINEDGSVLLRSTADSFQARLAWYRQFVTDKPSAHGKLTNITE